MVFRSIGLQPPETTEPSGSTTTTTTTTPATPPTPVPKNRRLRFRSVSITCNEETGADWMGEDEIKIGAVMTDDKENLSKIDEHKVGDFDEGDTMGLGELLGDFPLDDIYPKTFSVTVALAEEDNGGFAEWLQALYESIRDEVTLIISTLAAAAGTAIGAYIGNRRLNPSNRRIDHNILWSKSHRQ